MNELFDTHAHLDQPEFDADRADVVARAREAGVEEIITIGTTAATSEICVRLAAEFEGVYAAVGMQPNYIAESQPGDWERVLALVDQPGVVAIGETGPRPPLGFHALRSAAGLFRPPPAAIAAVRPAVRRPHPRLR